MKKDQLKKLLTQISTEKNLFIDLKISSAESLKIYPRSLNILDNTYLFIARSGLEKNLYIIFFNSADSLPRAFSGEVIKSDELESGTSIMRCPLNHDSAKVIQDLFDFTKPILIGTEKSFGFGDRLGIANPGHLRAISGTGIRPVLAQQSIRELERTERKPEDVMDAAVWAVLQEGYREGFGSDADHLKTTGDIDVMQRAGFTMFTFDPGDYVVNDAANMPPDELYERAKEIWWNELDDTLENFIKRYAGVRFTITGDFSLHPDRDEVLRGLVKYGNVIAHTVKLYRYIKDTYPYHPCEIELSIDETDSPTSPFEHFLIASELKRLGVQLVSLAPRFIGDFEKGIDYKGNIEQFTQEYSKHLKIAGSLGPYKISLHSGSDKFSVYEIIGQFKEGYYHVKTAGTSYLVALETIAFKDAALFREILDFSRNNYENEKKSYHVSADLQNVPSAENLTDTELVELFENDDVRQILHVNFGKVLTTRINETQYLFKNRILECLKENEDTHYEFLTRHIYRHIKPFIE